jgi:hypothetical protein
VASERWSGQRAASEQSCRDTATWSLGLLRSRLVTAAGRPTTNRQAEKRRLRRPRQDASQFPGYSEAEPNAPLVPEPVKKDGSRAGAHPKTD